MVGDTRSSPPPRTCPTSPTPAFAASLGLEAIEITDARTRSDRPGSRPWPPDRPTVLDVLHRPNVPPIPPHATFEQMQRRPGAHRHGDEDAWGVLKTGVHKRSRSSCPDDQGELRRVRSTAATPEHGRARAGACWTTSAPGASSGAWPGWPPPARSSRAAEIFTEHDGASFGNKMMWWPIVIVPTMAAGRDRGGVLSPGRQDGPPAGLRRRRRQRHSRAPTCTGGASCRSRGARATFATTSRWAAHVRARPGRPGRRDGHAGRPAAPGGRR